MSLNPFIVNLSRQNIRVASSSYVLLNGLPFQMRLTNRHQCGIYLVLPSDLV